MARVIVRVHWPQEVRTIPPETNSIEITVTAADISPPIVAIIAKEDIKDDIAEVSIHVPPGTNRLITAQAKDIGGVALSEGSATVDIIAGQTTQVNIFMIEGAELVVAPSALNLGPAAQQLTFEVRNVGDQPLDWSLSIPPTETWLSANPTSGSLNPGRLTEVTATVSRTGKDAGDYSADISITSNGGSAVVAVTMTILPSKIAFQSNRDGNWQIYVMNSDGSNQTNLTNNPWSDQDPSWSPDGSKIVFTGNRDGNLDIYLMNSDGSNQTRLTNNPAEDRAPSWSPDGSKIAFESYRDGNWEIYVMNSDGSNQTNLTNNPAWDWDPSWSPDGSKIAFWPNRDGNYEVYVMNSDGSNQTNLTINPAWDSEPSWSPDGRKIAFRSERDGQNWEIYVMNSDGSNQTRLTNNPADDWEPTWSPDGSKIAFSSDRDGDYEIYVMNADGTNQANLTNNPANDWSPSWSPPAAGLGSGNVIVQ